MLKIKIITIGKVKESWLEEAMEEYFKRLSNVAEIGFFLAKNDPQLIDIAKKEKSLICLDPAGKSFTSEEFASFLMSSLEKEGSKLSFLIGGAEGIPEILKKGTLISLSKMTFTHQMCRLILVEQIYRAFEMQKGSKYHK